MGKGRSVRSIAGELGVDESTLRYRLKRRAARVVDGRSQQPEACAGVAGVIEAWIAVQDWDGESGRPESVKSLYEQLVAEHGYVGSYKAVLRFVRRRAPAPKLRPVRRVETRPGTQAQVDWGVECAFRTSIGSPLTASPMISSRRRTASCFSVSPANVIWSTPYVYCRISPMASRISTSRIRKLLLTESAPTRPGLDCALGGEVTSLSRRQLPDPAFRQGQGGGRQGRSRYVHARTRRGNRCRCQVLPLRVPSNRRPQLSQLRAGPLARQPSGESRQW